MKETRLEAAISNGEPSCGLRPVLAAVSAASRVPKPEIRTVSPATTAEVIAENNESATSLTDF